jgi:hypothetical protein
MSSLERLPADQRAVLALVLQRGRSYDQIAELLAIDRAAVRDRALAALDALGPSESRVAPERRALITDYLLGQLPDRVRDDVRTRLATTPSERAWARVLAGELAPLATNPLPEIPAPAAASAPPAAPVPSVAQAPPVAPAPAAPAPGAAAEAPVTPAPDPTTPVPEPAASPPARAPAGTRAPAAADATQAPAAAAAETTARGSGRRVPPPTPGRRSSDRRGGGIFLALALVVVIAVVIIVIATNGSSSPKKSTTTKAGTTSTPTTTATTNPSTTTGTTTTAGATPHIVAKIVLRPTSSSSKALGAADVVTEGKVTGVIVTAIHLTPNTTHNAYAVWLATPGGAAHLLGYVSPAVGKSGKLQTTGPLPSNVASYKELLITLETTANTTSPGPAVLAGSLSLG